MNKKLVRLTEGDLHRIVKESVNRVLTEMDWKTYANAGKKTRQQYKDSVDPLEREKLYNRYKEFEKMANGRFSDEYIGDMKYDTFGDKWSGKKSPKFDGKFYLDKSEMPYQAIVGTNKGDNRIFSTKKGAYYGPHGYTTPRSFFRDKDVSDKFMRANDELWDYHNGDYEYKKGNGWQLKK